MAQTIHREMIIGMDDSALKISFIRMKKKKMIKFAGDQSELNSAQRLLTEASEADELDPEKTQELAKISIHMIDKMARTISGHIVAVDVAPRSTVQPLLRADVKDLVLSGIDSEDAEKAALAAALIKHVPDDRKPEWTPEKFEVEDLDEEGNTCVVERTWPQMSSGQRADWLADQHDVMAIVANALISGGNAVLLGKSRPRLAAALRPIGLSR
jgi:hypothetical protein